MNGSSESEKWFVGSLRLTVFPAPDIDLEKIPKWEAVIGEVPENRVNHPKAGVSQESGKYEKGILTLRVAPGRIDWLLNTAIETDNLLDSFPNIGELSITVEKFKLFGLSWLKSMHQLARMAFGANLILPTESHETAYEKLGYYLHGVKIDPVSSDFLYSINRPRPTKLALPGMNINRLSKWRAITWLLSANDVTKLTNFACNLELDINTAPSPHLKISKDDIGPLFEEFIDLGIEIAREGDVP